MTRATHLEKRYWNFTGLTFDSQTDAENHVEKRLSVLNEIAAKLRIAYFR